jgi:hypothetical protein
MPKSTNTISGARRMGIAQCERTQSAYGSPTGGRANPYELIYDDSATRPTDVYATPIPSYSPRMDAAAIMIKIHLLEIVGVVLLILIYLLVKVWRRI